MTTTYEYKIKPQGEVLRQFYLDRSRVSIIRGPLGSGKTIQTIQKILKIMCEQEPNAQGVRQTRWIAIRNTYSDLFNTTIKDWKGVCGHLGKFNEGGNKPPSQQLKFQIEDGTIVEAEMIFLALDRADSEKKLRGTQITGFWLNETKELNKKIVDMADSRHGRYPEYPTWRGMIGDTNSPDDDHWLYKIAEEEKPELWKFFVQPGGVIRDGVDSIGRIKWKPNPKAENIKNLPKGYYETMLAAKKDSWISVNLANEYGSDFDGKPIYPDYNDKLHCMSFEFIPEVPIYRGWDFGVPACALTQYTPKGRLIVRREFTSKQTMGIDRFAEHVLNECAIYHEYEFIDVGDPSGDNKSLQREGETCFTILRDKGIAIEEAPTQNPLIRQESVRYFLNQLIEGRPAFILHPDCKVMRKGFNGGYCLRRIQVTGDEKYTDKPDKHNPYSHIQDALQYIATYIRQATGIEEEEEFEVTLESGRSQIGGY